MLPLPARQQHTNTVCYNYAHDTTMLALPARQQHTNTVCYNYAHDTTILSLRLVPLAKWINHIIAAATFICIYFSVAAIVTVGRISQKFDFSAFHYLDK